MRRAAYALTALPVLAGVWLAVETLRAQAGRLGLLLHQGLGFADPYCHTGYCDHAMFWLAGQAVRTGQAPVLYDYPRYAAFASSLLPYQSGWEVFVYPPTILPLTVGLTALPMAASYYVMAALLLAASVALLRGAGVAWWCIVAGLLSPAALWNLYLGQIGLLCGALLVFGLSRSSGAALGLLIIKPQYALMLPFAVRSWRVAAAAGVVALALAGAAGAAAWGAYLGAGRGAARALLEMPFTLGSYQDMGSSVFWSARSLGAGLAVAYGVQGVVALAAAGATAWLWRGGHPQRVFVTLILTQLASPYGFTDDLAAYSVLLPALADQKTPWRNAALAWLWVAPAFVRKATLETGVLLTPLLLLAALALCLTQKEQPLLAEQIGQRA
jgi:hypothetical protein